MKARLFLVAVVLVLSTIRVNAQEQIPDFTKVGPHPRLFISDAEFARYKEAVKAPRSAELAALHSDEMERASKFSASDKHLVYHKDASGKRILSVSRDALNQIFSCSYAYRFTSGEKYLSRVESLLRDVCSFPDWNPSHYLDVGEMAMAVSIGYDWLYDSLDPSVRALAEEKLIGYALGTAGKAKGRRYKNNWNQVCNAGTLAACIAVFDKVPALAGELVMTSIQLNKSAAEGIYAPDGVYIEGPGYWGYGTMFQIAMNCLLKHSFGTDFGLEDVTGFKKTALYQMNMRGSTAYFVYSDCTSMPLGPQPRFWYFAEITGDWSLAYVEKQRIAMGQKSNDRLGPLYLFSAAKYDGSSMQAPASLTYSGGGKCPVAAIRTGWETDDLCLMIKGGSASNPHGHMDAGSFVYDAYGVRWATDIIRPSYEKSEVGMKKIGGNLWNMGQDSKRWDLSAYNNFNHNTLTVNDQYHVVKGYAPCLGLVEDGGFRGASFDLTKVLGPKVTRAERTAGLRDNDHLEVRDEIEAAEGDVVLRWSFVTPASVSVLPDGIVLKSGDKTLTLKASASDGVSDVSGNIKYCVWPSEPTGPCASFDAPFKGTVCGYSITVPAGSAVTLTTILTK